MVQNPHPPVRLQNPTTTLLQYFHTVYTCNKTKCDSNASHAKILSMGLDLLFHPSPHACPLQQVVDCGRRWNTYLVHSHKVPLFRQAVRTRWQTPMLCSNRRWVAPGYTWQEYRTNLRIVPSNRAHRQVICRVQNPCLHIYFGFNPHFSTFRPPKQEAYITDATELPDVPQPLELWRVCGRQCRGNHPSARSWDVGVEQTQPSTTLTNINGNLFDSKWSRQVSGAYSGHPDDSFPYISIVGNAWTDTQDFLFAQPMLLCAL